MLGPGKSFIWFVAGLLAILVGFWPSFFGHPASNDAWHIAHGIAATGWVLLLIAQSVLIGRRNRRWHERLGWMSLGLAAALVLTTGIMIRVELTGPEPFPAQVRQALVFLDVLFLILFAALVGLGLAVRKRRGRLHARLMGSTILIGLGPALVRLYAQLPHTGGLPGSVLLTFCTIEAILVIAIVFAVRRRQPVRPFPELLVAFVLIQIGLPWSMGSTFGGWLRAAGAPV